MNLEDYIDAIHSKDDYKTSFPDSFDLDKDFVKSCHDLYRESEKITKEIGQTVKIDQNKKIQISGNKEYGMPTSINLPDTVGKEYFGDIHSHPSASIGHTNGFAAHSPEDIKSMDHHTAKPVFVRFVCSGSNIYAVVYRNGHSVIKEKQIWKTRDKNLDLGRDFFDRKCHVTEDERNDQALFLEKSDKVSEYIHGLQRKTPGYGKYMEELSLSGAKDIAKDCKMAFYKGSHGTGWVLYWYSTLGMHKQ